MKKKIHIALAGNPNTGKSTIFNALTGSHQHVGNWPGKTVEKKEGVFKVQDVEVEVVDLPGTYSLSVYSPEEQIARDYIVEEKPDVVVNVVDAANLERNLYLTVQILETGIPVLIVLNMLDVAESRGYQVSSQRLAQMLPGASVVQTIASQGDGLAELRQAILQTGDRCPAPCQCHK
jgi:ferrous iron transport protein B